MIGVDVYLALPCLDLPCVTCYTGTYSEGGDLSPCLSCGKQQTSNPGACSKADCYPIKDHCPPGAFTPSDYVEMMRAVSQQPARQAFVDIAQAPAAAAGTAGMAAAAAAAAGAVRNNKNNSTSGSGVVKGAEEKVRIYRQLPPGLRPASPVAANVATAQFAGDSGAAGGDNAADEVDVELAAQYDSGYAEAHYHYMHTDTDSQCVCKPGWVVSASSYGRGQHFHTESAYKL